MTQTQRALAGLGALLIVIALVLTVSWDIALHRRRDYYEPLVSDPPANATAAQLSSDAYHFGHVAADLRNRWQPGGYAMVGATVTGIGTLLVVVPLVQSRRRRVHGRGDR